MEEKGGEQSDGEQRDLSLGSVIIAPIRAWNDRPTDGHVASS